MAVTQAARCFGSVEGKAATSQCVQRFGGRLVSGQAISRPSQAPKLNQVERRCQEVSIRKRRGRTDVRASAAAAASPSGDSPSGVSKENASPAPTTARPYSDKFYNVRLFSFALMFIGYASFYLTRNSLSFAAPAMVADPLLGFDKTSVGGLASILTIAYSMSKFVSGVLGARTSPTYLLAGGLMATAIVNIFFGFGTSYLWFCTFWGANGVLQGLGAPACARMLTAWFPTSERGTYWGLWTASNNIGGFLAPLLTGTAATHYGWRWGMYAPGIVGLAVGLIIILFLKPDPESAGLPPIEAPAPKQKSDGPAPVKKGMIQILKDEVLKNPFVWLFAITYFFVYVIRSGCTSWFVFYLKEAKDLTTGAAASRVSSLELGGLIGSLSSGAISDYFIRRNSNPNVGNVGLRVKVVIAYSAATAVALAMFMACPNIAWMQWASVASVGFALYGPQMLIGLIGAETVSPGAVGACQGFLGWISYLGSANAGAPLAYIVQQYGWSVYFGALIGSCLISILLLLPAANLKSYAQRVADGSETASKLA